MVECELYTHCEPHFEELSFNRYMVECEYKSGKTTHIAFLVLIDTWWNVNREDCHTLILTDTVLIDTWWNVNII